IYSYATPHRSLKNGDVLRAGRLRLEVLHTPGHTPEHISFVLLDPDVHGETPVAIFTGDFLFTGSLGRPDLLGEESKHGLAHELYRSVHQRIAHLPDATVVYPGHGAGSFCGAGIGAEAQSTLGHERSTQHLFHLDESDFVWELLAGVPPMPVYYPRMKRLNSAGAVAFDPIAPITALAASQVLASGEQTILLDLRSVPEFSHAHILGATNIGAGANLPLWAGWLLLPNRPVVLIDATGDVTAVQEARRALARVGLDRIVGMLAGGMQQWIAQGQRTHSLPLLSPAEVAEAGNQPASPLLVDVRTSDEWQAGHIPGALNLPLGELPRRIGELPTDREVVTICGGGYRASAAASLIARHGIRASVLRGGMEAWERQNLAITTAN
ncbi:MAG TPA: rhodanese-like domain-containing protein, partial [Edaphobacter sp.]